MILTSKNFSYERLDKHSRCSTARDLLIDCSNSVALAIVIYLTTSVVFHETINSQEHLGWGLIVEQATNIVSWHRPNCTDKTRKLTASNLNLIIQILPLTESPTTFLACSLSYSVPK